MAKVENGNKVSVHYRGTLNDGTEFDSSYSRNEPITFTVGSGQMISGFDAAIPGMEVGEKKTISIESSEAYGDKNDEAVQTVPREMFPPEFQFIVGATIQGQNQDGQPFMAKICSEEENGVVLDFNHPLAGEDLNFDIELTEIS